MPLYGGGRSDTFTPLPGSVNYGANRAVDVGDFSRSYTSPMLAAEPRSSITPGANQSMSSLTDDFAGKDTAKWTWLAAAAVASGQLSEPVNNAFTGNITSVGTYDLTDSAAFVQLVQRPNAGNGGTVGYFQLNYGSDTNRNSLLFQVQASTLVCQYRLADATVVNAASLTYDSVAHAWWRIRASAGTVYWDTSPNGTTWTNRASWSPTFPITALYAIVGAGYGGTEPSPGTAIWDNFNLAAPSVDAGVDAAALTNAAFTRTATESANGSAITSRAWTIQAGPAGVGSTIGTAAAPSWTPSVAGTYTLRYSATNANGTTTDDAVIGVIDAPLTPWINALAAKNATAVHVGDSITEGQGASTRANRWVDKIQSPVRSSAGISGGGVGYLPAFYAVYAPDSTWTPYTSISGTITNTTTDLSLGDRVDQLAAGASITYTVTGTAADLHWIAGYGSFTWNVDSGSATTVNTSGTTGAPSRTTISLGASASHTLVITATTAVRFSGVVVYDGDATTGARFLDSGHVGWYSDSFAGHGALWSLVGGNVATIELGPNDFLHRPGSASAVKSNVQSLITDIRTAIGPANVSIVLLVPGSTYSPTPDAGQTQTWADYRTALLSIATDDPTVYALDLPNLTSGQMSSDSIHPNDSGHTAYANAIAAALSLSSAAGSITLAGSGVAQAPTSSTGGISLSGAPAGQARAAGAGSLSLSGTAAPTVSGSAPGSITLSGSGATGQAVASSAGTITLGGAATETAIASGGITLSGGGTPTAQGGVAGSITLSGSSTFTAKATGSITLSGSGTGSAAAVSSAQINLSGAPAAAGQAGSTGSIVLGATGLAPSAQGSAAGSITLGGTGTATQPGSSAAGNIGLTGSAVAAARASAGGTISLGANPSAAATANGAGTIQLSGAAAPSAPASSLGNLQLVGAAQLSALANAAGQIELSGLATGQVSSGPIDITLIVGALTRRTLTATATSRTTTTSATTRGLAVTSSRRTLNGRLET